MKGGTRGRTRTGTLFTARDFESRVSTNFTTLASKGRYSRSLFLTVKHSAVTAANAKVGSANALVIAAGQQRCIEAPVDIR